MTPVQCPCNTPRKPVLLNSGRGISVRLRCPVCGRRGFARRMSEVVDGWNKKMAYERLAAEGSQLETDE